MSSATAVEQKLKKSLGRFKERIENGSYYEAQQTIRSIANRYVFTKNFNAAISLLYESANILLEFKQYDEAADLFLYMIEIGNNLDNLYDDNGLQFINKIENLIKIFPNNDNNLINLVKEISKFINLKNGNDKGIPKINRIVGEKLIGSGNIVALNQSEKYLFLNNDIKSIDLIVNFEFNSFKLNNFENIGLYLSRCLVPYLLIKNIKFSEISMIKFLDLFLTSKPDTEFDEISNMRILRDENFKIVNFLQLLIKLLSNGSNGDSFSLLFKRYLTDIKKTDGLYERVNQVSVIYFNMSFIKKQTNLLQNMMGNLLGGN